MRVLMVHNYYQHRGGEGISFKAEAEALRALGHEVDVYTLDNAVDLPRLSRLRVAVRTIWSLDAYREIRDVLRLGRYDLVHVQNFFPLISPSVYDAARSCRVPVVQTLRNYRLFCMQTGLFREGKICEECPVSSSHWPGVKNRCYRGSLSASVVCGLMLTLHSLRGTWKRRVDAYIAISEFVKRKYVENGWRAEHVFVKHNTVSPDPGEGMGERHQFVVAGRLAEDKGLEMLLDAWGLFWSELGVHDGADWRLKIIGEGPKLEALRELVSRKGLKDHVVFSGRLPVEEVYGEIGMAAAVIQPSVRYEPFGRTIVEAYAKGTPVIAADIGGGSELVDEGKTGFLFCAGSAEDLGQVLLRFVKQDARGIGALRQHARAKFDRAFAARINAEELVGVYSEVIDRYHASEAG